WLGWRSSAAATSRSARTRTRPPSSTTCRWARGWRGARASRRTASSTSTSTRGSGAQVALRADLVRLGKPALDLRIHLVRRMEPEDVHLVARRVDVDPPEPRAIAAPRQDDVAVHPVEAERQRGEAHAHLEGDPGLLRDQGHRA